MREHKRNQIRLSRETLRELTASDLGRATGGLTPVIKTLPPEQCISYTCGDCHSLRCTPDV
ncbi:MAG TPA: hypothetical protein VF137_10555 [Candidatus Dormibacteraeota bacterium]